MQMFCSGNALHLPNAVNASRMIKPGEKELCKQNGVREVFQLMIGYDGIVLASASGGDRKPLNISKKDLFLALAKKIPSGGKLIDNPYKKWNEINPELPNLKIAVLGPPPTSGTRDAIGELIMEKGCEQVKNAAQLGLVKDACKMIREDGAWTDAGENDNLIIQKLVSDPDRYGLFGFAFYRENKAVVQAALIDRIAPTTKTVISGAYPVSRPLFVYFKADQFKTFPDLALFAKEFISGDAAGEYGYLSESGLAPLPKNEAEKMRQALETVLERENLGKSRLVSVNTETIGDRE